MRPLPCILFVISCTLSPCWGDERTLDERVSESIEMLSQNLDLEQEGFVVARIEDGQRRIEAKGRINRGGPDAGGDTLYEIGSITKVFTGIALADAVLREKVGLDDSITRFLPEDLVEKDSPLHQITFKQLATHTSGLPRLPDNLATEGMDPTDPYAHYDEELLFQSLSDITPDSIKSKGEISYSNFAMGLLGHLLGRINQCSYAELIDKLVFTPLEMEDSFVSVSKDSIPSSHHDRLARGHSGGKEVSAWHLNSLSGAGAIVSTADDLLIFAEAHWSPETPERLRKAMGLAIRRQVKDMGLGWFHSAEHVVGHDGQTGGFKSSIQLNLEKRTAFLTLQNGVHPGAGRDQKGDFSAVAGLWFGDLEAGTTLPLLFNILTDGTTVLYSLNQGSQPITSGTSSFSNQQLQLSFPEIGGNLSARMKAEKLDGTWTQGSPLPLQLSRVTELPAKLKKSFEKRYPDELKPIEGFWSGKISQAELFVYIEILPVGSQHEVLFFSPTQTPQPIRVSKVRFDGKTLSFTVPSVRGSFRARLKPRGKLEGHWNQGQSLALDLEHSTTRPSP
ncbi:MAG: serine hydrolase domain-containing protein [Verrucomicrobiota bacterium]